MIRPNHYLDEMDAVNERAEIEYRKYNVAIGICAGLIVASVCGLVFRAEIASFFTPFKTGVLVGMVLGQFSLALVLALVTKPCGEQS